MFKQISMKNFKSWRETGPVRLAPLTGFFGANSSGKSSLLQMLLLLKKTTESNDRSLPLETGGMQDDYVNLGTPYDITHGNENEMRMEVTWRLPPTKSKPTELRIPVPDDGGSVSINELTFETSIYAELQRVYVRSLRYSHDSDLDVRFTRSANNRYTLDVRVNGETPVRVPGRPRVYMKPEKCYSFSDEALRYYQSTSYLSDLVLQFERQFDSLHYLGPLREYPQRDYTWGGGSPPNVGYKGELAIHALLAGGSAKVYSDGRRSQSKLMQRIAKWLVDLGLATSFRVEPLFLGSSQYSVRLKRLRRSPEVLITDLGIGVSQVLPVLVLCYYVPEGSTIILEQPELHLHPSVQAGLADVFIDVIKNRNVQILLESHSEHLLRRLQRRIAEEAFEPDDAALYFCEMRDGESMLTPLEIDMFGDIRNWPDDFFGDLLGEVVGAFDAGLQRKQALANGS